MRRRCARAAAVAIAAVLLLPVAAQTGAPAGEAAADERSPARLRLDAIRAGLVQLRFVKERRR